VCSSDLGVTKAFHDTAVKVGRPVARKAVEHANKFVASECPLAGRHIVDVMRKEADKKELGTAPLPMGGESRHPIELFALAYGF